MSNLHKLDKTKFNNNRLLKENHQSQSPSRSLSIDLRGQLDIIQFELYSLGQSFLIFEIDLFTFLVFFQSLVLFVLSFNWLSLFLSLINLCVLLVFLILLWFFSVLLSSFVFQLLFFLSFLSLYLFLVVLVVRLLQLFLVEHSCRFLVSQKFKFHSGADLKQTQLLLILRSLNCRLLGL